MTRKPRPAAPNVPALLASIREVAIERAAHRWATLGDIVDGAVPDPMLPVAVLPIAGGLAVGGSDETLVPVAAAVALFDIALRAVDDLADDDDATSLPATLGAGPAINAVLALQATATELLARHADQSLTAATDALVRVCRGQHHDMTGSATTLDEYRSVVADKTAAAFGFAMRIGALAARGQPTHVDAAAASGRQIGHVIQILNDVEAMWFDPPDVPPETRTFAVLTGLADPTHPRYGELDRAVARRVDRRTLTTILDRMEVRQRLLAEALHHRDRALQQLSECPGRSGVELVEHFFDWLLSGAAALIGLDPPG